MSKVKHTPGPWYWHFDAQSRASLRTPDRGQLIVMDFVRQGMHSAMPRFAVWPKMENGVARERLGGIMKPLPQITGSLLAEHPDARLIAAAPDLLAACMAQDRAECFNANCPDCEGEGDWAECETCTAYFSEAIDLRQSALAKAIRSYENENAADVEGMVARSGYGSVHSPKSKPMLITEMLAKVQQYFGADAEINLEVIQDPEDGDSKLFAFITTSLPVNEALLQRNRFDEEWWLEASEEFQGQLIFDIKFIS